MRQIKFRGKSLKNKKWVYGDLMRNICATRIVRYKETDNESVQRADWDYIEVDDSTVGQFTGLTDRNGKEVYEGDIVRYIDANDEPKTSEVRFVDAAFSPLTEIMWMGDMECEVIGNIFDNRNLIEHD